MSRYFRTLSTISLLSLISSLVMVAAPVTVVEAQTTDPCAGITNPAQNCIVVDRADDPFPIDLQNPTSLPAPNSEIRCTAAGNDCTLRGALTAANRLGGADRARIVFRMPQSGDGYLAQPLGPGGQIVETWTIDVVRALPALTRDNIEIDGFSQENSLFGSQNEFGPTVIIDGINLSANGLPSRGLTINSSNNIIRGLGIIRFDTVSGAIGIGIEIAREGGNLATGNLIQGCYIGINAVGSQAAPNAYGIWINTDNNTIGGNISTNGERNIISGNLLDGIWVTSASGNKIRGNYIGINRVGQAAVPNGTNLATGGSGITLRTSSNNTIGPEPTELFNLSFGNVISGNRSHGIQIFNGSNNQILGNLIGTNTNGIAPIPNLLDGVLVASDNGTAQNNQIGAATSDATRNIISGNTLAGVRISGDNTFNNRVQNNYIGPRQNGFLPLQATAAFAQTGVIIQDGADNNLIGGAGTGEGNVISANPGNGVEILADRLEGASAQGNQIVGNLIGPSIRNLAPNQVTLGNGGHGVFLNGNLGPIVDTTIAGNTITGNGTAIGTPNGHGVYVLTRNSEIRNTTLRQNVVGLLGTVDAPLEPGTAQAPSTAGNRGDGIRFERSAGSTKRLNSVTIGSADPAQRNIISRNDGNGIHLFSADSTGIFTTTIQRNTIQNNTLNGILAVRTVNTTIDGQAADPPNLITNNGQNGIQFTDSTTITVRLNTVRENGASGVTLAGASYRDITIAANTILTNTLTGIRGSGGTTFNTLIEENTVRGHNGSGIRWDTVPFDTIIRGNTVYSNTLLGGGATAPAFGILLGDPNSNGARATIAENRVRGSANGPGITLIRVDQAAILDNLEVNRNRQEGIRVTGPALNTQIFGNTVISNNVSLPATQGATAPAAGGITLSSTNRAVVVGNTANGHTGIPGILVTADNTTMRSNTALRNLIGLSVTGGFSTTVSTSTFERNAQHGVQVSATNIFTLTEQSRVAFNGGSGVLISGDTQQVDILTTSVLSNTVNGIQIGAGGAGPHPQRVRILDNSITGNGIPVNAQGQPTIPYPVAEGFRGRGIVFNPEGPGTTATNPNHDIIPPSQISLSSNGLVRGRVDISGGPASCTPAQQCRVQVFRPNRFSQDGQGRDKLGEGFPDATGAFTVSVGTLPTQVALTATDAAGNTSRFGLFTASPGIAISPPRTASAAPGQVITFTHQVENTGNIDFANLRLSATSSRGWTDIRLFPPGEFRLAPGQSAPVTVTVRLPTGSDPRVIAGGNPDLLTVTVQGSVQFQGEPQPRAVRAELVNTTTVQPRVVLEITPAGLNGRGLPGTVLPYAHVIRNNGNIESTFTLSATTNLGAAWATQLTPSGSITLRPGEQRAVSLLVTIPPRSTQVQSGTVALTTLRITTTTPADPTQNREVTNTTTVTLDPQATLVPDQVADARADQVVSFVHRATNRSNGPATFRLRYTSSLGSTITFQSQTTGVTMTGAGGDTFTIQSDPNRGPTELVFVANVRVNRQALIGQRDSIIISLEDARGNVIGGAFVRNTINVAGNADAPRVFLPLTLR